MTGGSQARVLACDPIVILACDPIVNLDWGTFAIWIMSHPRQHTQRVIGFRADIFCPLPRAEFRIRSIPWAAEIGVVISCPRDTASLIPFWQSYLCAPRREK